MSNVDEMAKRLGDARKVVDEDSQKKSRLTGELDGYKKQMKVLKEECKEKFDCEVKELPGLSEELKERAEGKLSEAEGVLGIQ